MSKFKFGNRKIYKIDGVEHLFHTDRDAQYYCETNGIDVRAITKYDSKKEYERWLELSRQEEQGLIFNLRRQVEFEIIPAYFETQYVRTKVVNDWVVENEHFTTQKLAYAYCKEHGLQQAAVICKKISEPVYKETCIQQKAIYTADFVYFKDGEMVVEDVKSDITRKEADYVLRKKLMYDRHRIKILET